MADKDLVVTFNKGAATMSNLTTLQTIAGFAALLHDIGKDNVQFQKKLRKKHKAQDTIKHEWVSLLIWTAIAQSKSTQEIADFLSNVSAASVKAQFVAMHASDKRTKTDPQNSSSLSHSPFKLLTSPFAQLIGILIVSHHRFLTFYGEEYAAKTEQIKYQSLNFHWFKYITDDPSPETENNSDACWDISFKIFDDSALQSKIKAFAEKFKFLPETFNDATFHAALYNLVLADHYYSSLQPDSPLRITIPKSKASNVYANTHYDGTLKQTLVEHLIGVSNKTLELTANQSDWPTYKNTSAKLTETVTSKEYSWQNTAIEACQANSQAVADRGGIIFLMAGTGTGKTIGAAKIVNALSGGNLRYTIATSMRSLAAQFRNDYVSTVISDKSAVGVLIGGKASKIQYLDESNGSPSINDPMIDLNIELDADLSTYTPNIQITTLLEKSHSRQHNIIASLLNTPILICTIDHIMPSSESAGPAKGIPAYLRVGSSDLVIEEADSYSADDIEAVKRLIYMSASLGRYVVIVSATTSSQQHDGFVQAYCSGRQAFNENGRITQSQPVVGHINHSSVQFVDADSSPQSFTSFVEQSPVGAQRGIAQIVPIAGVNDTDAGKYAETVLRVAQEYHADNCHDVGNYKVSIGYKKFSHTTTLINVYEEIARLSPAQDTHVHVLIYHSRMLYAIKSNIDSKLDAILNRKNDNWKNNQQVVDEMHKYPNIKNHIFIVFATSVLEVGRDLDFDWMLIEPSTVTGLVQSHGRLRRHRRTKYDKINLGLMELNFKAFCEPKKFVVYSKPGPESGVNYLADKNMTIAMGFGDNNNISAQMTQLKVLQVSTHHKNTLIQVEQRQQDILSGLSQDFFNRPIARFTRVHATRISPFRDDNGRQTLNFSYDPQNNVFCKLGKLNDYSSAVQNRMRWDDEIVEGSAITAWQFGDIQSLFDEFCARYSKYTSDEVAQIFFTVQIPEQLDKTKSNERWVGSYHQGFKRDV